MLFYSAKWEISLDHRRQTARIQGEVMCVPKTEPIHVNFRSKFTEGIEGNLQQRIDRKFWNWYDALANYNKNEVCLFLHVNTKASFHRLVRSITMINSLHTKPVFFSSCFFTFLKQQNLRLPWWTKVPLLSVEKFSLQSTAYESSNLPVLRWYRRYISYLLKKPNISRDIKKLNKLVQF